MTKGHKETFGGAGYVCYLDCVDGLYVFKYVKIYTLNIYPISYVNYV